MTTFPYDPDGYGLEAPAIPDEAVAAFCRSWYPSEDAESLRELVAYHLECEDVRYALAAALPIVQMFDQELVVTYREELDLANTRITELEVELSRTKAAHRRVHGHVTTATSRIAELEELVGDADICITCNHLSFNHDDRTFDAACLRDGCDCDALHLHEGGVCPHHD